MNGINVCYYRSRDGNFGDDLNLVLWEKILPGKKIEYITHDAKRTMEYEHLKSIFYFIGTLLDNRVPHSPVKYVFGSGSGYFSPPNIDHTWNIFFVRGPRTAELLGIDPTKYSLIDPGYLITRFDIGSDGSMHDVGFIPHHDSTAFGRWQVVCQRLGLSYICPHASPLEVAHKISKSKIIVTEFMHGAIFADALRVPWIPVKTPHTNDFKWKDWCDAICIPYDPIYLPALHYEYSTSVGRVKLTIKQKSAEARLRDTLSCPRTYLSGDSKLRNFQRKLDEQCDKLRELVEGLSVGVKRG